jgi:AcrR family transcriptional regulator
MTEHDGRRRAARGSLTPTTILDAALDVIDEAGLEGLTMRRLGAALGADAMAMYGHFENKAALLDALVERESARLAELDGTWPDDPMEMAVHLGQHYRRVLLAHPNLAPLVASRPLPQQEAPAIVTFGVRVLQDAGFRDEDIPVAADAMVTFMLGFVLQEAGRTRVRAELGDEFHQQQESLRRRLAELPEDTTIAEAVVARRLEDGATQEEFETGLRAMLHGLRLGLGARPSRPRP